MHDCTAFERWLDDGRPALQAEAAHAHASGCARCASLLVLEDALAAPFAAPAPRGFADAVMLRVRDAEHRRAIARARIEAPAPWWVSAPAEPAAALALVGASLLLWRAADVWRGAVALAGTCSAWAAGAGFTGLTAALGGAFAPARALGATAQSTLLFVAGTATLAAAWGLYAAADRVVARASGFVRGAGTPATRR